MVGKGYYERYRYQSHVKRKDTRRGSVPGKQIVVDGSGGPGWVEWLLLERRLEIYGWSGGGDLP